jgi:hypothetical protein
MLPTRLAHLCILAIGILAIPASTFAGTVSTGKETKTVVPEEKLKETCITGDIGVTVVSQYITRGLILENQGAIVQPFADLYFKLYEGDGFLNKATLNLGIWASLHDQKTQAGLASGAGRSTTRNWFEFDWTAGVSLVFAKNITFTPSIYSFTSPNDAFDTFYGLNLALAYDDTDLLGAFALHPKVQVMFELENKAGNGADEGVYYEIAIAPGFPVGPVTVSFPIAAGFGSSDFYANDETYGFFTAGLSLGYGLSFVPECYGKWNVTTGAAYYHLGSALDTFNSPGIRPSEGREHEVIYSAGLVVAF